MRSGEFISWANGQHPVENAESAYNNGYYLEAIQILHSWMECKFREMLIMVGAEVFKQDTDKISDIANSLPLNNVIKVLYTLNQITQKEYQENNKLNRLRNELIHKYFYSPNDYNYEGVPKKEFDKVFNRMTKLAHEIEERVSEIGDIEYELKVVGIARNFPFDFHTDANKLLVEKRSSSGVYRIDGEEIMEIKE